MSSFWRHAGWLAVVTACAPRPHDGAAASAKKPGPAPHLVCDAPNVDFGRRDEGERLTHAFALRNTGSAPLRIVDVRPSYSCTAVTIPARIEPGASAELSVLCETEGRPNRVADTLVVHSDDPAAPEYPLHVDAQMDPALEFASRTVDLEVAFGESRTEEVRLLGRLAAGVHLAIETVDPPGPEVNVLPAMEGRGPGLRFTVTGDRVGRAGGQVVVATGVDKPRQMTVLYSYEVHGNLTVEPSNPFIDLRAPGPDGVVIRVRSRRPDFQVRDIVVDGPFDVASAPATAEREVAMRVRVRRDAVVPGARGVAGALHVLSNDPAESRKSVPLFALGPAIRPDP